MRRSWGSTHGLTSQRLVAAATMLIRSPLALAAYAPVATRASLRGVMTRTSSSQAMAAAMSMMKQRQRQEQQVRRCSTSSAPSSSDGVDPVASLHEEIHMLTDAPLPIGTLFKTLSPESRAFLNAHKLPLETFLLRYPAKYSVFKQLKSSQIMVSRFGAAPESARHATEKTREQLFNGQPAGAAAAASGSSGDKSVTTRIYTVLRYIPNEWVQYALLNIPEDVRKNCIGKPPKRFFEKHPRYFEVRFDPHRAHTFELRRSLALQQYMASQDAQARNSNKQ